MFRFINFATVIVFLVTMFADWLSDEYGWCHFGFETETDDGGIIKCDTLPE